MKAELTPAMLRAMERKPALRTLPPGAEMFDAGSIIDSNGPIVAQATEWKFTIPGVPLGKPRMTRRDQWKKRRCVVRFRAWADVARASAPKDLTTDPLTVSWTAFLPLPPSWSKAKSEAHRGTLHRKKPDRDNIDKGILDALFKSDCGVADGTLVKRWDDGKGPRIEIHVTAL